jgi:hypothetical protein
VAKADGRPGLEPCRRRRLRCLDRSCQLARRRATLKLIVG